MKSSYEFSQHFTLLYLCRRARIQQWAADELLSDSLADLLVMNDRLHAELERWEHANQSVVLSQSKPMVRHTSVIASFTVWR